MKLPLLLLIFLGVLSLAVIYAAMRLIIKETLRDIPRYQLREGGDEIWDQKA